MTLKELKEWLLGYKSACTNEVICKFIDEVVAKIDVSSLGGWEDYIEPLKPYPHPYHPIVTMYGCPSVEWKPIDENKYTAGTDPYDSK